ncbi:SH3 domain-containing protein [Cytobacillus firmus]|uniref:SH3 domain-containing protein n=1 Tax=Cytobacillus firmus TaxID=1399 RepID=UPI00218727BD|nr:SH3 domain-containing protein [Cytobacillus firmus]URM33414.1 SH3 domain-containing protein [Cytobacillus firmus]
MMNKNRKFIWFFCLFLVAGLFLSTNDQNTVEAAEASKAGIIASTSYANIYRGPGKAFGLSGERVNKGELVSVYQTSSGWTYIKSSQGYGWVWGEYVKASSGIGILNNSYANLYNNAASGSGTKGRIEQGTSVVFFESVNGWKHVYANGEDGWVWGEFVSASQGMGVISSSYANLYKGPAQSYGTKGSVKSGMTVAITSDIKNGWRKIYVNGQGAWVWDGNIAKDSFENPSVAKINNPGYVNVYNSKGKTNGTKGRVLNGEYVTVFQHSDGWAYVQSKDLEGWVWGAFVTELALDGMNKPSGSLGQKPVTANVNVYKAPGKAEGIIGSLPKGEVVSYYTSYSGWRYIHAGHIEGWVWDEFINTYLTLDLLKPSNITAYEVNRYIESYEKQTGKKSIIAGKGQAFIDAGNKYGINAHFLAALTIHESAFGTSNLSYGKYNLFGLKAFDVAPFDAALRFKSVEEGITYEAAYVRFNYLVPSGAYFNGSHLGDKQAGMNVKYSTDPLWGEKIAKHMQNMKVYDGNYYNKVNSQSSILSMPPVPDNKDSYPANIKVTAKQQLSLYETKGGGKIGYIAKGKTFELLEKYNNFWLKIKLDGKQYWTFFSFSYFKDYMQVHNLMRAETADNTGIKVYQNSSASSQTIDTLSNNTYFEVVVDSGNNPVTDSTKGWYKIKTAKGQTGWLQASKAKRIYN